MAGNDSGQSGRIGQRQENVNHGVPFVDNDSYPQAPWDGMLVYNEDVSQFQIYSLEEQGWLDPYLGATGNQTYVGPDEPVGPDRKIGDLWIKTPENALHIYTSSGWLDYTDPRIADKNQTFVSTDINPPTPGAIGDLWIVSNLGNLTRRWSGTDWIDLNLGAETLTGTIPDSVLDGTLLQGQAEQAILDAASAGTVAEDARDQAAQAILDAGNAAAAAEDASEAAAAAIELANAAPTVTTSDAPPADPKADDLWFMPVAGNKLFTWNGIEWVPATGSVAPDSISDLELSDLSITVKKFRTSTHMIY